MTEDFMEDVLLSILCVTLAIGILTMLFGLGLLWTTFLVCSIVLLGVSLVFLGILLARYNKRAK